MIWKCKYGRSVKKFLGAEHPDTVQSMTTLAVTYYALKRLDEAEGLEVRVLEGRKILLGAEHPDILSSINHLAMTYYDLNRLNEEEEQEVQV